MKDVKRVVQLYFEKNADLSDLINELFLFWSNNPFATEETFGRYFEKEIYSILSILEQKLNN